MAKSGDTSAEIKTAPLASIARGLNRVQAARYIGVSPTKFDEMISDGRMPRPRRVDGRTIWDTWELDAAFDELPHDGEPERNPWDGTKIERG